ncbi:Integrin alpha-X [Apodemus speciosus]|uniref:Integrin alpha-X n=1 Tax=Apodemus speciosus TaxID=105296 RepID=A0ABQ0F0G1_APOSI
MTWQLFPSCWSLRACFCSPAMSRTWIVFLLLMVFVSCLGFNLDAEKPTHFHMDGAEFGHSVLQYDSSWVVVGAPKEIKATNQIGGLYKCGYHTGKCEPIYLQVPPEAVNMSLGLSLAAATNPSRLLACGPTVHHICRENTYLTGLCFLLTSSFRQNQRFPTVQQECPRQDQDIVFLIDGSGSISSADFQKMLHFVKAVMWQLQRPSTRFSLMQFSNAFWIHFTFKDFISTSSPLSLLDSVTQLRGYTYTASAIKHVITKLFTAQSGARQDATRVLIVITDGRKEMDKLNYDSVIPMAEAAGIIRYAIGVGKAFYNAQSRKELETIASMPSHEYMFSVENFDALKDIENQLKEKIFAIEDDGPLLGAVGSFSWSGGAFLYPPNMRPTFINMSQESVDMRDAYLEIGSYFGASLCSVDMDRDGSTDLVLIGGSRWQCVATLHGEQGHPWGRFGAALTVLGDVNGDSVVDVAVGAPGEEENRGAVYIFHGASRQDVTSSPSQRISGSQISSRLQYFGQSLSGGQDLTWDGLVDLAVGSKGYVLLLRTRPILRVSSTIRFTPAEISRSVFECQEQAAREQTLGDVVVCLHIRKSPEIQLGDLQSIVTFDLALDSGRLSPRAIFKETRTRALTRVKTLGLEKHCESVKMLLPTCVEDSVTPITLRLNFSLVGVPIPSLKNLQPVLAEDDQTYFTASVSLLFMMLGTKGDSQAEELPFEKNCGADHICQDDLGIIFGVPNLKTLLVGSNLELDVDVEVSNDGEDSYGTTVTLFYPVGLSFRRVAEGQVFLRKKERGCVSCTDHLPRLQFYLDDSRH